SGEHVGGRDDRDLFPLHREALDRDQPTGDRERLVALRDQVRDIVDQLLEVDEASRELVLEGQRLEGDRRRGSGRRVGRGGRAGARRGRGRRGAAGVAACGRGRGGGR